MISASSRRTMSDPLIRACDHYVVLEPGQPERLLSASDTLAWLEGQLERLERLPEDLQVTGSIGAAALRLLETACDLELSPGVTVQWFAVRLEPPARD